MNKQIPNLITALNLVCGMLAMIALKDRSLEVTVMYLAFALFFDLLDGAVARALGVSGELGKQLDSLADVVSFGVVPGFIMFYMIVDVNQTDYQQLNYAGFLVTVFSAFRLAKFNIDKRQSDAFYGLPTPANTALIVSYWAIYASNQETVFKTLLHNPYMLAGLCALSSIMLVMDVRLIALKFKNLDFQENIFRYLLIAITLGVMVIFGLTGVPIIIGSYILLSMVENIVKPQ